MISARRPARFDLLLLLVAIVVLALASPATAQRRLEGQRVGGGRLYQNPAGQALGNGSVNTPNGILGNDVLSQGDALDGSLEVGSGGRNYRSARMNAYTYQNLQARNLVVTNNVAGGRGFRGDVGYLAPRDFRGETSGDANYGFNRDSALSSLDLVGSSRAQDAFNIAQGMGVFQYRREFTSLPEVNSVTGVQRIDDAEIRLDRINPALGSQSLLSTAVAPADIGIVRAAEDQTFAVSSSSVRGVQYRPAADRTPGVYEEALRNGATITDGLDLANELIQPREFESTFEVVEPREKQLGRVEGKLVGNEAHDRILERVLRNYEGRDDVKIDAAGIQRLRRDTERVDAQIGPRRINDPNEERPRNTDVRRDGKPGDRFSVEEPSDESVDPLASDETTGNQPASEEAEADEAEKPAEKQAGDGPRTVEELLLAYAHRTSLDTVVDPQMRARTAEIAAQAQQAMEQGEYFKAEGRLDLALKLSPRNPILEAARANAQIGAGLYRSAALTLTGLYRRHKEMMDVSWDESVRPSTARLLYAASDIESMIAKDPERASGLGIVVAYIGRQLGDRKLVGTGLDLVQDDRLTDLVRQLRSVWLSPRPYAESAPEQSD